MSSINKPYVLTNLSNAALLQIILHGYEKLSLNSNTKILEETLNYIQTSERFL